MAGLLSICEPLPVMISDIRGRNYSEVKRQLGLANDPNKHIDTSQFSMAGLVLMLNTIGTPLFFMATGLEYSVFRLDWKMFLIFFLGGTDPNRNLFDGILHSILSFLGHGDPIMYEAFRSSEEGEFKRIPGFRGLQCILDDVVDVVRFSEEDLSKMRATLWLTEQLHHGNDHATIIVLGSSDMISTARRNCLLLDNDFDWESSFSSKITSCLAILKQISVVYQVPEATLHSVIEHRLHQLLNGAIRECLEGIIRGITPTVAKANEES